MKENFKDNDVGSFPNLTKKLKWLLIKIENLHFDKLDYLMLSMLLMIPEIMGYWKKYFRNVFVEELQGIN
jgi:hypothetical protein